MQPDTITLGPAFWAVAGVVFLLVEIATPTFLFMWFAAGAFLVAVLAALGMSGLAPQLLVFSAVSSLLVLASRTLFKGYFLKGSPGAGARTNVEALLGQQAVVLQAIDNAHGEGQVRLSGMEWSARSASGARIEAGTKVVVVQIDGVKLVVEPEAGELDPVTQGDKP